MTAYYNEIDLYAAQWLRNLISAGLIAPNIRQRLYWVADTNMQRPGPARPHAQGTADAGGAGEVNRMADPGVQRRSDSDSRPGPVNGFWRNADWLYCRDGKWRAVEPGTQPLAPGHPARVGKLRAYGNAVNAEVAKTFIGGYLNNA